MILTEMPDLPPRPSTPRNAAFRANFYRHWGRENCVVSGSTRRAEYQPFRQTLSIKCVARGTETYYLDRRRITVSDENYLVLNEGRTYASSLETAAEAYSFALFFRPGAQAEVAGDLARPIGRGLDDGPGAFRTAVEFEECLRPHDATVTPVLRYIQRHVVAGLRDEQWLEEQCQFLLARLLRSRFRATECGADLDSATVRQRAELGRRLQLAVDFMHERLAEQISLAEIADAAHLSRFHFLRLFRSTRGMTPITYLRALRTRRALALLASTRLSTEEVAGRVGMSRIALWRALRDAGGSGARALRARSPAHFVAFLPDDSLKAAL